MEQYLDLAFRFWNEFSSWSPPKVVLYTVLGFGLLTAWIMTHFVEAPPLFAGPISFIVLTFAAMVSNFALRGNVMMGITDLQKALIYTTLGHAVAGFILLILFRASEKRAQK
jgi:hypothetical protein